MMSIWAEQTGDNEPDYTTSNIRVVPVRVYSNHNMVAPIASGSFQADGMVAVPYSMKNPLSAISSG
ncbi:hypothetical protein BGZ61DRAFT_461279 [Ilyonectria robusta]|uniref:uncharacterized protein n=1 Tax=Ilyonectria robusta TaxID=1079257 RepID=UPI001E8E1D24|nr:uncharacterized protein BGZ61DRAFT_461279 [Ilyonectria robusta]KAH8667129.1 hypothetical protein BGZ61DRAFT_461279 [Ilyonectria robusta]